MTQQCHEGPADFYWKSVLLGWDLMTVWTTRINHHVTGNIRRFYLCWEEKHYTTQLSAMNKKRRQQLSNNTYIHCGIQMMQGSMMPLPAGTVETWQDAVCTNFLPCYQRVATETRICQIRRCSFSPQLSTLATHSNMSFLFSADSSRQ